jgi:hypothetical protein
LVLALTAPAYGQGILNSLSDAEKADGWSLLWDGKATEGWETAVNSRMELAEGAMRQAQGAFIWLRHKTRYADFVLRLEFRMLTEDADSGVFIRAAGEGDPTQTGYQININNMNPDYGTGSVVNRAKYNGSKVKTGQWYSYEITAEGDRISAVLDGRKTIDFRDSTAREGFIGFQLVKPLEIEFRNIRLKNLRRAVR